MIVPRIPLLVYVLDCEEMHMGYSGKKERSISYIGKVSEGFEFKFGIEEFTTAKVAVGKVARL